MAKDFSVGFGRLDRRITLPPRKPEAPYAVGLVGDFSGRGDAVAPGQLVKPQLIELDRFDAVMAEVNPGWRASAREHRPAMRFASLDDFHPDALLARSGAWVPRLRPSSGRGRSRRGAPREPQSHRALRRLLADSEFQAREALWRGADMLLRRFDDSVEACLALIDLGRNALDADLRAREDLSTSGLFATAASGPGKASGATRYSLLAVAHTVRFDLAGAELLGRCAKVAAALDLPMVFEAEPTDWNSQHLFADDAAVAAWMALRAAPEARYVALAAPRFLLRQPYGARTDPIGLEGFEEFTRETGVASLLWGSPVLLVALVLGWRARVRGAAQVEQRVLQVDGLPQVWFRDEAGDTIALPSTRVLLDPARSARLAGAGTIPLVAAKSEGLVRLGAIRAASGAWLEGPWPAPDVEPAPLLTPFARARADAEAQARGASGAPAAGDDEPRNEPDTGADGQADSDAGAAGAAAGGSASGDDFDAFLASLSGGSDGAGGDSAVSTDSASTFEFSESEVSADATADDGMDPELAALLASLK